MRQVIKNTLGAALASISMLVATSQTVVMADPSLGSFDILNSDNSPMNANFLQENKNYILKLSVQNLHFTNSIPSGAAFVDIGLGTKMTFDSLVDLNPTSLKEYFTFQFVNGTQKKIRCILQKPLPNDFFGEATFRIRPTLQGSSVITGNFLVSNGNPLFTLSDMNSSNNTADISYTVVANSALPVNIVDFKGMIADCKANVRWTVSYETNVDRYVLESSSNGREFSSVAEVQATGAPEYKVQLGADVYKKASKLSFRIRAIDRDGSAKYSHVITVVNTCNAKSNAYLLYPNPIAENELATVSSKKENFNGTYRLQVSDVLGKVVMMRTVNVIDSKTFQFPHQQLSSGKYFLLLEGETEGQTEVLQFEKL